MKKNFIVICGLLFLISSTNGKISRSNIWRSKNLVRGARLYYEQTLPLLYEYLNGIGQRNLSRLVKQAILKIKNLETSVEIALQNNLSTQEKNALATDRKNLELYQILMNAKVPNEINLLFDKLENITRNVAPDIRNYREEIAEIMPKKLALDEKIMSLQKQLADLQNQKVKLLSSISPALTEYYNRMKQGSDYIFEQTKRIGTAIEREAKTEFQQVDLLQKKIENLKKSRVTPSLLIQLENAKKAKISLFEKVTEETSRLGETEMIRFSSIVDLLNHVNLTTKAILSGPEEIKKWNLTKDILRVNPPK